MSAVQYEYKGAARRQLARLAAHAPTVADMVSTRYPVGAVIQTHGYRVAGDGGACQYVVIGSTFATASYDIPGPRGTAYRPTVCGVIHPRQFGTINDGTTLDNLPLQACYDYSRDHGLFTIDGQGLTYTIGTENPYDPPGTRGWSHTGAIMQSGRTLQNAHLITATGATAGTVPLSVLMTEDMHPTFLRDVTVDGNEPNVSSTSGREDGGLHGLHLYHPKVDTTPVAERDFYPCGNVYLDNVTIRNCYSYGGRPENLDCLVRLTDCNIDVTGPGFLVHSTRFEVQGGEFNTRPVADGRVRVRSMFTTEMELAYTYSGTKRVAASFADFTYDPGEGATSRALYKVHYPPMNGVNFGTVSFRNVDAGASGFLDVSTAGANANPNPTILDIGCVELDQHCRTTAVYAVRLSSESATPNGITTRVRKIKWDGKTGPGYIQITGAVTVDDLTLNSPNIVEEGRLVTLGGVTLGKVHISNMQSMSMGVSGFLRDTTGGTVINHLIITGGEMAQLGDAFGAFDCHISKADVAGVTIHPNQSGRHVRLLMLRNSTAEITLRDVLLTGTAYRSSSYPLIYSTAMDDGFIHLSNVRHLTAPAEPELGVPNLAPGRIIKDRVSPLYAA